jgi:TRAP-type C4-dicarboxylate transport system permease small subunit
MSETDALVARLRRANRRWKALAVVACWALALAVLAAISWRQVEINRRLAEANRALGVATGSPPPRSH